MMPPEFTGQQTPANDEPIVVRTDTVTGRLLPAFLARRAKDLDVIEQELERGGFRAIERMGHNLKGVGRSYGLDGISDVGAKLQVAGQQRDAAQVRTLAAEMAAYLGRVRLVSG
jgi:HPt (histidine-containing phosphotransfer) domain-containing protein